MSATVQQSPPHSNTTTVHTGTISPIHVSVPSETSTVASVVELEQGTSGSDLESDSPRKSCRNKRLICIIEKLNMVFLIFFVCYLAWTIPANYGLFTGGSSSHPDNHSITDDEGQNNIQVSDLIDRSIN